jgi:2,5-furandicarboxylate decarboxylase 1
MASNKSIRDLRLFLDFLERQKQLVRVKREVNLEYELAGILWKTLKVSGPALLFEKVGNSIPVVGGVLGTPRRFGLALGLSEEDLTDEYLTSINWEKQCKVIQIIRRAISEPTQYKKVRSGPVEEVIEDNVDLLKLPVPKWFEYDGGLYITGGVVIAKNPNTDILNMGVYRIQILGKDKLTIYAAPGHDLHTIFELAERRREEIDVAIAIGVDPPTLIAAALSAPPDISELCVAGTLRRAPLDVVPCKSVDLVVPANAEIVIEGKVDPKSKVKEGPFGEYTGFYSESLCPLTKIKTIYHRANPLFYVCLPGPKPGHESFLCIPRLGLAHKILKKLKLKYSNVEAVAFSGYGTLDHLIVSINKKIEGEPVAVINEIFNMVIDEEPVAWRVKRVTVVDAEDINIHDLEEVEFAINTYPRDKSSVVILNVQSPFDIAAENGSSIRVGLDATKPLTVKTKLRRVRIPVLNKIRIEDYLFS